MSSRRLHPTLPIVAAALVSAALLSACTSGAGGGQGVGSSGSSSGVAPTSGPGVAASDSTASGMADDSPGVVDVCGIVTAADVEQLFPGTVTAAPEPTNASGCSYVFAPEDQGLSIEAVTGDQAQMFWTGNVAPNGTDTVALSGIGDKAMRAPGEPDLVALKGSTFCEVETNGAPELYQGLATPDPSDIVPDDTANAVAQKLGTLCDKIFAAR